MGGPEEKGKGIIEAFKPLVGKANIKTNLLDRSAPAVRGIIGASMGTIAPLSIGKVIPASIINPAFNRPMKEKKNVAPSAQDVAGPNARFNIDRSKRKIIKRYLK